ncbi:MAG: hypothetical protein JRH18_19345 [Deltaproteobacteria bacterium]|nr:hypothetical protein [Deltaproteobacteria bacterium]MBW2153808.1 hypothetical protein [Deltaproteobacteria bacterium]
MHYYRLIITLLGPLGTELVSGTIWGHLAWAIRYIEGQQALERWLEEQEREPWLISSQMPEGMLPKPILPAIPVYQDISNIDDMILFKRLKKTGFLSEDTFISLRKSMNEFALMEKLKAEVMKDKSSDITKQNGFLTTYMAHNRIDRLSGRTPDTGGLFFEESKISAPKSRLQIFIATQTDEMQRLQTLFDFIGSSGFGANASTGYGSMQFEIKEENTLFAVEGSFAMSLSHGVSTANMVEMRYKQHVHFGKLGAHYAAGSFSPFKFPILMTKPGATFKPLDQGPYGRILRNVHHDNALSHIRHYAVHFPIFFTEVST